MTKKQIMEMIADVLQESPVCGISIDSCYVTTSKRGVELNRKAAEILAR